MARMKKTALLLVIWIFVFAPSLNRSLIFCFLFKTTLVHKCPTQSFQCKSGLCIPSNWICDGKKDCLDGEDEIAGCSSPRVRAILFKLTDDFYIDHIRWKFWGSNLLFQMAATYHYLVTKTFIERNFIHPSSSNRLLIMKVH